MRLSICTITKRSYLWFEHDLYDQLQLIQILDWFSHQDLVHTRLSFISVNSYLSLICGMK
jgi:hypothetical protein